MIAGTLFSFGFIFVALLGPAQAGAVTPDTPPPLAKQSCQDVDFVETALKHYHQSQRGGQNDAQRSEQVKRAIAALEAGLDCNPFDSKARALICDLYVDTRDFKSFEEHFKTLAAFSPNEPRGLTTLGRFLRMSGQPEAALNFQKRAVELAPDDPFCQAALAFTLYTLDNSSRDAEQIYRTVLTLTDGAHDIRSQDERYAAFVMLGKILAARNDRPAATRMMQSAMALDPDRCEAYSGLAKVYLGHRDYAKALEYVEKALELYPGAEFIRKIRDDILLQGNGQKKTRENGGEIL